MEPERTPTEHGPLSINLRALAVLMQDLLDVGPGWCPTRCAGGTVLHDTEWVCKVCKARGGAIDALRVRMPVFRPGSYPRVVDPEAVAFARQWLIDNAVVSEAEVEPIIAQLVHGACAPALHVVRDPDPTDRTEQRRKEAIENAKRVRLGRAVDAARRRTSRYAVVEGRTRSCILIPAAWLDAVDRSLRDRSSPRTEPHASRALAGLRYASELLRYCYRGPTGVIVGNAAVMKYAFPGRRRQDATKAIGWLGLQGVKQLRRVKGAVRDRDEWTLPLPTVEELVELAYVPAPDVAHDGSLHDRDLYVLYVLHRKAEQQLLADLQARAERGESIDAGADPRNHIKFANQFLSLSGTCASARVRQADARLLFPFDRRGRTVDASLKRLAAAGWIRIHGGRRERMIYLTPTRGPQRPKPSKPRST